MLSSTDASIASASVRWARGRLAALAATLTAVLALALLLGVPPAQAAEDDPGGPGPLVALPFSNRLFPDPTTGDAGPDALNALVAQECNQGEPLGERQWFTLPSEGSGLLSGRGTQEYWVGSARSPDYAKVGVALVDHVAGEVLGCGSTPVAVVDGDPRSFVVWAAAGPPSGCEEEWCSVEALEAFVNWTSGRPANDRWQDATPIAAVPYQAPVDTALATTDPPVLTPFCWYSWIDPVDASSAWWSFTPTVSGALPVSAVGTETYGGAGQKPVFSPDVAVGRLTDDGPEILKPYTESDCENPQMAEVEAGTTYLISVHDYIDPYYGSPLVTGGRATVSVGALRPTAPRDVTVTPDDGSVVVAWSAPAHAGSGPVTGYRVRQLPDGPTTEVAPDARSFTATGLTNGQEYTFEVTALNAAGPGNTTRSPVVRVTTGENRVPSRPEDVTVQVDPAARTATLAWRAPSSPGASSITHYVITRSGSTTTGDGPLSEVVPAHGRSYTLSHLRSSTSYDISLRAVNAYGDGAAHQDDLLVTSTTPSTPRDVEAEAGPGLATLTWRAPEEGGPPTGYRIRAHLVEGGSLAGTATVGGDATSYLFNHLDEGTAYTFDVTAINDAGTGEVSPPAGPVTPQAPPPWPATPTAVTAIQGTAPGTATLTWGPPPDNGSPITGYLVQRDGRDTGGAGPWSTTLPATARSFTFTHLNIWATYHLTVQALNVRGSGPAGSASVTIEDPRPSPPTSVTATAGNAAVTVRWAPPLHGDAPITGYRIRRYKGSSTTAAATTTVAGDAVRATLTGLVNGTAYRFDVTAINAAGTGRASARTTAVTPATVPGAPTIGTATSGTAGGTITATATWTPPTSTGGSAITGYRVTALRVDADGTVLGTTVSAVQPASARSLSMTLPQLGRYRFTVKAANAVGSGAASARSNAVSGR